MMFLCLRPFESIKRKISIRSQSLLALLNLVQRVATYLPTGVVRMRHLQPLASNAVQHASPVAW